MVAHLNYTDTLHCYLPFFFNQTNTANELPDSALPGPPVDSKVLISECLRPHPHQPSCNMWNTAMRIVICGMDVAEGLGSVHPTYYFLCSAFHVRPQTRASAWHIILCTQIKKQRSTWLRGRTFSHYDVVLNRNSGLLATKTLYISSQNKTNCYDKNRTTHA